MKPRAGTEFFLQWGSRKRLRCVRVRPAQVSSSSNTSSSSRIRRRISSRFLTLSHRQPSSSQPNSCHTRNREMATLRSVDPGSAFPEEDRIYATRGSMVGLEEKGKMRVGEVAGNGDGHDQENDGHHQNCSNNNNNHGMKMSSSCLRKNWVWPKLCVGLSSKEKEEDFMAMKGCKLPQRPKKRAKFIQKTLLLVSPGEWLTDMSLGRYEVREKKNSRKKARGLKAMGSIGSDSE